MGIKVCWEAEFVYLKGTFISDIRTDEKQGRGGSDIMSQVINSQHLQLSQIKGPSLHQGQLLHNGVLANHLSDVLLLKLSSGMANKAQGHIYPLFFLLAPHIDFPLFLWVVTEQD